jgi:hypothetical protein
MPVTAKAKAKEPAAEVESTAEERAAMDAYKRDVRRRALMAKRSQGWNPESLNRTLRTLGLEPTGAAKVQVEVVAKGTWWREVASTGDAEATAVIAKDMNNDILISGNVQWEVVERSDPRTMVIGEDVEPDPVAMGTDLVAYKKLVRRVGLLVAAEQGWCDSGVNEYLQALGLPPKQTYRVPVDAVVAQRLTVPVVDAESYEEAVELVRGLTAEEAEKRLHDGGVGVGLSIKSTAVIDQSELRVGDPEFDRAQTQYCVSTHGGRLYNPEGTAMCTRENNHVGDHHAGNGSVITHIWPR